MTDKEKIIDLICNKVALINIAIERGSDIRKLRDELNGMLSCLYAIIPDTEFYCVNYFADGVTFVKSNSNGKWLTLAD